MKLHIATFYLANSDIFRLGKLMGADVYIPMATTATVFPLRNCCVTCSTDTLQFAMGTVSME